MIKYIFYFKTRAISNILATKDFKQKIIISILFKILILALFPIVVNKTEILTEEVQVGQGSNEQHNNYEEDFFVARFDNLNYIQTLEDILTYIFYVDSTAYVKEEDFPLQDLANLDLSINLKGNVPRILITHTHSSEYFVDSDKGNIDHTIVGIGRYLANIFANTHGVSVVHDIGVYDVVNNEVTREGSYERTETGIRNILDRHPSIEVIIDLHRDAAPEGIHFVTEINGYPTAKLMFFNGITRRNIGGVAHDLYDLFNPYIKENIALSLQLFLTANEMYEGLARKNYIKAYRYSLHILPRSMLVEVGANTNTVQEAKNAMYPLANIIMEVLNK